MGTIRVSRESIALAEIDGDEVLSERIRALRPGDVLILAVGGYVGRWERSGVGISPLDGNVRQAWGAMRAGDLVDVHLVTTDGAGLVTFGTRGEFWDPPESQYR